MEYKISENLENISDDDEVAPDVDVEEEVETDKSEHSDDRSLNGSDITELELDESNVEFEEPVIYVEVS